MANPEGLHFKWTTSKAELDGPFSFHACEFKDLFYKIIPKLHHFETMTWAQVRGSGSHPITYDKLHKDAQDRMLTAFADELDVYSLRFEGKVRVFGLRENATFQMIWYDPDHRVCPAPKKHT